MPDLKPLRVTTASLRTKKPKSTYNAFCASAQPIDSRVCPRRKKQSGPLRSAERHATIVFVLTLPNLLSLLRIALIPFLVYFLTDTGPLFSALAALTFFIASVTYYLDGYLA